MKMRLVGVARPAGPQGKYDRILTVSFIPGPIAKFFGSKPYTSRFVGSCSVWRSYPNCTRQPTYMESRLADWDSWCDLHNVETMTTYGFEADGRALQMPPDKSV